MQTSSLSLEQTMLEQGAARYARQQAKAKAQGQLTSAESKLFTDAVGAVAALMLEEHAGCRGRGRKPAWFDAVDILGSLFTAVAVLRVAFACTGDRSDIRTVLARIGRQVELELIAKALQLSEVKPGMSPKEQREALKAGQDVYSRVLKRASKRWKADDKAATFTELAKQRQLWNPLDTSEHVKVGGALFALVLQACDIFDTSTEMTEDGPMVIVTLTPEAIERIGQIEELESWMHPVFKPMLNKPKDWTDAFTGCYEEPKLAATVPLAGTKFARHRDRINAAAKAGAPFLRAVNAIQSVPMRGNPVVANYMQWAADQKLELKGFPKRLKESDAEKMSERERRDFLRDQGAVAKELRTTLAATQEYLGYGTFYMPAVLDWRSRVYAKPHVNHQREESVKAFFQFDQGQILTPEGAMYLAIHLCNSGAFPWENGRKLDKAPLDVRYQWTRDNTDRILSMVDNPAADTWWTEADSPLMFLAACEAWAGYVRDPDNYACHLPVGVDGSNSGLQHFSAMLRDPQGGAHVNLIPQDLPADVYQTVADKVAPLVQADADSVNIYAIRWLKIGVTRKVAKRCVMTYVYGSKQFGFAEHLAEDFASELKAAVLADIKRHDDEEKREFEKRINREIKATAFYLAKHIWTAVKDTVKAAAAAMDWLMSVTGLLASKGMALDWVTPSGFPVVNAYFEPQTERIELTLWDRALKISKRVNPTVMTGITKELNKTKCRNSVSPNFVHSLDAAHLHLCVLKAQEEGIESVMLIHDSFSCLPNDMPRFVQIVRETFVDMYTDNDPLQGVYESARHALAGDLETLAKLNPPPSKGNLDLNMVLESHYAFA